jgi:hypothetical protein
MSKKLIHALRKIDEWGARLEPEGRLTPLSVVVGAALAAVAFTTGRFIDSALEDREALLARHRWETAHRRQLTQDAETDAEVHAA